jgi:S-DNA-T family DNA segregation ATPase FtsK/SpoIIIE
VVGAITLIALMLPGEGRLTDWWRNAVAPWFGTGRWLLPFVLVGTGLYIQQDRIGRGRWVAGSIAIFVSLLAFLGMIEAANVANGGRLGRAIGDVLSRLLTQPGAVIALAGVTVGGLLFAADRPIQWLLAHLGRGARAVGGTLTAPSDTAEESASRAVQAPPALRGNGRAVPAGPTGRAPDEESEATRPSSRAPSPAPMSQTIWSAREGGEQGPRVPAGAAARPGLAGSAGGAAGQELAGSDGAAAGLPSELEPAVDVRDVTWELPTPALLEQRAAVTHGGEMDHQENITDIEKKLRSFGIESKVVAVNSGPVVTQYEVRPDARVKISRIEGLADDLAMALMARSIRIEAPIPGKDTVGIEIPNVKSETVGFRALVDDTQMVAATSRLTFALGRDVSGKAYAVDLAKMPHLLVAGATGSGKSVCVNALITSILMHARPDEVRLILVDLKRVELAPYDGLPHLLQHVIVEPHEAKAALNWAVHQMEERYKLLASHTVRNIAAYNEKVGPDEHLPYVVLVIDELADLIMREGRKVEDPIVKIAQKARAVGIHLVLATQRPSVNVVTGLIKANVPSRIAFAMASMVDSRTVLDQPGAEDLIGRGDMLYQPVDLPRPVRMQGVFVSDKEVSAVVDHWKRQAPEPYYDPAIFAFIDGEEGGNGGQFTWLARMAEDDMVVRAAELVTSSGRASTSNLQTKLKVGFSRASRLMDELERYGVIGPQDPRNPATPRIVYGPDNWLRSLDEIDDPGN